MNLPTLEIIKNANTFEDEFTGTMVNPYWAGLLQGAIFTNMIQL